MNQYNNKWSVWCYVASPLMATAFKLSAQCSGVENRSNNEVTNSFITHTHTHTLHQDPYTLPKLWCVCWWCWWAELTPKDCLAVTTIIIMELKQLNLFLFATGFHSNTTSSCHKLPVPRSRLTASLAKGHTWMRTRSRTQAPAGLRSLSSPAALKLTRKKPLSRCCWPQAWLRGCWHDVNKSGSVGPNRSDIVRKSLMAPNHLSNIVIFWFLQAWESYKTLGKVAKLEKETTH